MISAILYLFEEPMSVNWTAVSAADITNNVVTTLKVANPASTHYISAIMVANMHATVATRVDILDGANVIWTGPAAALGGGYAVAFQIPIQCSFNTALNVQCGTSGAAVRVAISGYDA